MIYEEWEIIGNILLIICFIIALIGISISSKCKRDTILGLRIRHLVRFMLKKKITNYRYEDKNYSILITSKKHKELTDTEIQELIDKNLL